MQLTQYQVMQGMLVSSANNYADSLAIWAYGSMENYLTAANVYLKKHGLTNITVADASGFSPESKSNATNLVKLGTLAMTHPVIADIVSQQIATLPGAGTLHTTNLLLMQNEVVGIKTGTTDEAGSCLLFAAKYTVGDTPVTIIGASLGGPNHTVLARDVKNILASTKAGFHEVTLAKLGQSFASYKTPWGIEANAVTNKNTKVVMWPGMQISQRIQVSNLHPNNRGIEQKVGTVAFKAGNQTYESALVLNRPLEKPSWLWRLTHPQKVIKRY
jgi:D-alanyl-D-alanine carboxypeptidase (penicillin-binding protein 5/6)